MRQASIQVEVIEEDGCLILIFSGRCGSKHREILPFATEAARRVNKSLYYTLRAILQEYQPVGLVEGSIVQEEHKDAIQ